MGLLLEIYVVVYNFFEKNVEKCGGKWIYFVILRNYQFNEKNMLQFLGNIEAKVDAKGRIFVPAIFRKQLQNANETFLVLRKDVFQDCLVLYPGSVWESEVELLRSRLNKWNASQQQVFRQFVLDAERIEMDVSGRILLSKRYLTMVSIDVEVRFLGVDNTIEIWSKEKLNQPLVPPDEFSAKLQELLGKDESF